MPHLAFDCPHCHVEKIGFAPLTVAAVRSTPDTLLVMQCQGCGHGLIVVVRSSPHAVSSWMGNNQATALGPIVDTYPKAPAQKCPADVPPDVNKAFLSGLDNLTRKNGANAASMMFRRSIEVATKIVKPDIPKGTDLKKRIEGLPSEVATPAMKEWAQHIRLEGNDAAHEIEEFSEDDAKKLHVFAEMFLTYAFTLPEMLKKAKGPPKA